MRVKATVKEGTLLKLSKDEVIAPSEQEKIDEWAEWFRMYLVDVAIRGEDVTITIERRRKVPDYTI